MGTGVGRGDTRAVEAASAAISSPLLEDLSIEGARGVLINITGGADMTLFEVNEASSLVHEAAHEEANIIVGAVIDDSLDEDELRVTVIATGLDSEDAQRGLQTPRRRIAEPAEEIERERAMVDAPNVRRIHEESAQAGEAGIAPQASAEQAEVPAEQPTARTAAPDADEMTKTGLPGFESPFEDELDTPAFLRKRSGGAADDPEVPAFMRRGGGD
jgi:cell division protein FtsZ